MERTTLARIVALAALLGSAVAVAADSTLCDSPYGYRNQSIASYPWNDVRPAFSMTVGDSFGCYIAESGQALCWGKDPLLTGEETRPPIKEQFISIDCGGYHCCGVTRQGHVSAQLQREVFMLCSG